MTIFGQTKVFESYKNNNKYKEFLEFTKKISTIYVGPEKSVAFAQRNSVDGAVLFRIKSKKIIAAKDTAD